MKREWRNELRMPTGMEGVPGLLALSAWYGAV